MSRINVLHRYDPEFVDSLNQVKSVHQDVNWVQEESFRDDSLRLVASSNDYCAFLVDDILFKEETQVNSIIDVMQKNQSVFCFSLRLGLHLNYCFPTDSQMNVPNGSVMNGLFAWLWKGCSYDWGYPLSLDGHVFRKGQILELMNAIPFKNPNELESNLQHIMGMAELPPHCVSFIRSSIMNIPMNRVQNDFKNRCMQISAESLHDTWKQGFEIDWQSLSGYLNRGPHEDITVNYRRRND